MMEFIYTFVVRKLILHMKWFILFIRNGKQKNPWVPTITVQTSRYNKSDLNIIIFIKNLITSLNFILIINKKVEHYIKIKIHKFI